MRVVDATRIPQVAWWLEHTGHEVTPAGLPGELPEKCAEAEAVVVSTAFLTSPRLLSLVRVLRRYCPGCRVLALCGPGVPRGILDGLEAAGAICLVGDVDVNALTKAMQKPTGYGELPTRPVSAVERVKISLRLWRTRALQRIGGSRRRREGRRAPTPRDLKEVVR